MNKHKLFDIAEGDSIPLTFFKDTAQGETENYFWLMKRQCGNERAKAGTSNCSLVFINKFLSKDVSTRALKSFMYFMSTATTHQTYHHMPSGTTTS